MLTQAQIDEYNRVGAIVVPDILSPAEVAELRRVTDMFVEKSRAVATHTDIFDLEDTHTPAQPRVRRIKAPHLHDAAYGALVRHPRIVEVLCDLWGPNVRFDTAKLNLKSAGYGAAVEWHQDWAFYPHTNDDLAAVGVMMDDMELANGPLMIIPGSHKVPRVFDHHAEGKFCGAMDPARRDVDFLDGAAADGSGGVDHGASCAGGAWLGGEYFQQGPAAAAVPVPRRGRVAAGERAEGYRRVRQADRDGRADAGAAGHQRAGAAAAAARRSARLDL